jgi:hypothetical protein
LRNKLVLIKLDSLQATRVRSNYVRFPTVKGQTYTRVPTGTHRVFKITQGLQDYTQD